MSASAPTVPTSSTSTVVCILVGFLATLGTFLTLTLTGHDASQVVPTVALLLGLTGVSARVEQHARQQNAVITKIDSQTNGVLTGRIQDGARAALEQAVADGLLVAAPPKPTGRKPAAARKTAARKTTAAK